MFCCTSSHCLCNVSSMQSTNPLHIESAFLEDHSEYSSHGDQSHVFIFFQTNNNLKKKNGAPTNSQLFVVPVNIYQTPYKDKRTEDGIQPQKLNKWTFACSSPAVIHVPAMFETWFVYTNSIIWNYHAIYRLSQWDIVNKCVISSQPMSIDLFHLQIVLCFYNH